ncbi:MAG: DUF4124 domain-containing protein [Woeseiaceae bacterium]|nr:DUF4124 domain-containing protein [Woeseiaceae bacterium]
MRRLLATILVLSLLPLAALAGQKQTPKLYRWVDNDGVVHYGDSIPAEFAEIERQVVNDHGITVDVMEAKKTEEQLAEERRQEELRQARELQRRADQALLATYLSVEEIVLHRDRRVELFQAQARVTELYLSNLKRRLEKLQVEASRYRPYSQNPDAEMIDPDLAADIATTKDTIAKHEANLRKFQEDEQNIVARFDGDIDRFKKLKGLN